VDVVVADVFAAGLGGGLAVVLEGLDDIAADVADGRLQLHG